MNDAKALRTARAWAGYTQQDIAYCSNVSTSLISLIEGGHRPMSPELWEQTCRVTAIPRELRELLQKTRNRKPR